MIITAGAETEIQDSVSDIRFEASADRVKTAPELSPEIVSLDTHVKTQVAR